MIDSDTMCSGQLIIDSGSSKNIIFQETVTKLNLKIETHPQPNKLPWFKKGSKVNVTERCLVDLSIGSRYFGKV
jgi:hypothetical protein